MVKRTVFPMIAPGTVSSEPSGLFEYGSGTWMLSPQISMPIFDLGAWSALKVTKVEREIALAQYEAAIQTAFREVADALAKNYTLGDQMAARQSLVSATEATCWISNARYEKGVDIYLNVLDAQRSLCAAQQGPISARLADLTNRVRLYAALGGGGRS